MSHETCSMVLYKEVLAKRQRTASELAKASVPLWARYGWEGVALLLGIEFTLLFVIGGVL